MNSEFDIIRRYFSRAPKHALLGVGDDAALVACSPGKDWAISTDTLVAGRHFFPDVAPDKLAYKALAVNLSDMAAMGAAPRWVTLSLTLTEALAQNDDWLKGFASGFFALADLYQVELIGGDTTGGPLNIGVQIIGEIPAGKALKRSGAVSGDDIWISGELGNAAMGLAYLQRRLVLTAEEASPCLRALHAPLPRVRLGQRLLMLAHSAIDISDGLVADLSHILARSDVAAVIDLEKIPCSSAMKSRLSLGHTDRQLVIDCLLAGGDDYELCMTAPESKREAIVRLAHELDIPLSRIGKIMTGSGLTILTTTGNPVIVERKGHDHFLAR
ncbi:MAG: thiamine-phosphate kinase [Nitrosomonas halophila]